MTKEEAQIGVRVRFIATAPAHANLTGIIVENDMKYPHEPCVRVVIDGRRDPTPEELARPRIVPGAPGYAEDAEFWEQFRGCGRWPQIVNPAWLVKETS